MAMKEMGREKGRKEDGKKRKVKNKR